MSEEFLVIDTEGADIISEIAIINDYGRLIYEAFVETQTIITKVNSKPLKEIVEDLGEILPNQTIVCHNAKHDQKILRNTFAKYSQPFPAVRFICTLQLALKIYPYFPSHSLKYLSKKLLLKVDHLFFQDSHGHQARYDAKFTWQLYLHLQSMTRKPTPSPSISNSPNPFISNRVDSPFQNHLDFDHIYQHQFNYLRSIIEEFKTDSNKQSKAAVIIGEAGSGKTHLMMRLAKATLKTNRLLYVRQPNNPESVNHHIYARILESFAQKVRVENSHRTQLELLLARSFTKILKLIQAQDQTKKLSGLITNLEKNSLSLYEKLGQEGTQTHRNNWRYIETKITQWWESKYSAGGYAPQILRGIIKFCSYKENPVSGIQYKDQVRRWLAGIELDTEILETIGLSNWQEDISREDFALEAMSLFGQLSTLDEPLIIVFDQLEALIHNPALLISFGNAIREILTQVPNSLVIVNLFPDRWQKFQEYFDASVTERLSQHSLTLQRPSHGELKQLLRLKCETVGMKLEQLFTTEELNIILAESSVRKVINQASNYFRYKTTNEPLSNNSQPSLNDKSPSYPHLSVEQKLAQLETTIQQIVDACMPIIQGLSPSTEITISQQSPPKTEQTLATESDDNSPHSQEKVIINYLTQEEKALSDDYYNPHIITDDDDWGKLVQIIKAFQSYDHNIKIDQLNLGKKVLPNHLLIINKHNQYLVGFLHISGSGFTYRIKNFNQLAVSHHQIKFTLIRDERENPITGKVGRREIEKLDYTDNGQFMIMDKSNRVVFELIYKMIVDINQGDLDVSLPQAISTLISRYKDYWLIQMLFVVE